MATGESREKDDLRGRTAMQNLWKKYSSAPTIESMMLNENASKISTRDEQQILSVLPDLKGKNVLELGAGIGRFTKHLVERCGHLWATDLIETFIETNKSEHGHFPNIEFSVDDVTALDYKPQSFDFVFTNWIFMYLTDDEVVTSVTKIMKWLKSGGKFHFRESCTESSNKKKSQNVAENPTYYRHISQYLNFLHKVRVEQDGGMWKLQVSWTNSIEVYITDHNNWRQVHMIVEKIPADDDTLPINEVLLAELGKKTLDKQAKAAGRHEAAKKLLKESVSPLEPYMLQCLSNCEMPVGPSSILSIGTLPQIAEVSVYNLANMLKDSEVFHLETNAYHYSALLDEANTISNQQIRILWSPSQDLEKGFCPIFANQFHFVFGCAVFSECESATQTLENIKILKEAGFNKIDIRMVGGDVDSSVGKSLEDAKKANQHTNLSGDGTEVVQEWSTWFSKYRNWYLIRASN